MEAKKQLRQRHKEACLELKKAASPFIENETLNKVAIAIGKNVGVSFQTVVNYVYGKSKDGYLTEAMTQQFKNTIPE